MKKYPDYYLGSSKGSDFEERISEGLNMHGCSRVVRDDISENFSMIKEKCKEVNSTDIIKNIDSHKNHFVTQPCGSQDYPDFWIFCEEFIFSVEVKFSQGKIAKPVWNSGLPRPNGIYIFGSYKMKAITFFKGVDIIEKEEVTKLRDFFDSLKLQQENFNHSKLKSQKYGFAAYSRAAYEQNKRFNRNAVTNYFSNLEREKLEQNVMNYVS